MIPLWALLALGFSVAGALIIGFNQYFKFDSRVLIVWRVLGIIPVAVATWWFLPWPTEVWFYALSAGLGVASTVGDVLLYSASAKHGGRLAALYVPMKMLIGFVLWCMVDPASFWVLVANPLHLVGILLCFGGAFWSLTHIRRSDASWTALLAVLPVALIFAGEDVIEKLVLPHGDMMQSLGYTSAMVVVLLSVSAIPALIGLKGRLPTDARTVLASTAFGVLLTVGIGILVLALVVSPNPGYVGAVSSLSVVWLALWARVRQGERNNLWAILALVASAIGVVVLVSTLK